MKHLLITGLLMLGMGTCSFVTSVGEEEEEQPQLPRQEELKKRPRVKKKRIVTVKRPRLELEEESEPESEPESDHYESELSRDGEEAEEPLSGITQAEPRGAAESSLTLEELPEELAEPIRSSMRIAEIGLYDALLSGSVARVKETLELGASPARWGSYSAGLCLSPLFCALDSGDVEKGRLLVQYGAPLTENFLLEAVKKLDLNYLKFILERMPLALKVSPFLLKAVYRVLSKVEPGSQAAAKISKVVIWLITHMIDSNDPATVSYLSDLYAAGLFTTSDLKVIPFAKALPSIAWAILRGQEEVVSKIEELANQPYPVIDVDNFANRLFPLAIATSNQAVAGLIAGKFGNYLTDETLSEAFQNAITVGQSEMLNLVAPLIRDAQWPELLSYGLERAALQGNEMVVAWIIEMAEGLTAVERIPFIALLPTIDMLTALIANEQNERLAQYHQRIIDALWRQLELRRIVREPSLPIEIEDLPSDLQTMYFAQFYQ